MVLDKLETLVIKPLMQCNSECSFCESRLELYEQNRLETPLSLTDWDAIIGDACDLGLKSIFISGGEPTLYTDLVELVSICKRYNLRIGLNSNGTLFTDGFCESLSTAGLDSCTISIYSHDPEKHNEIRGMTDAYQRASNSLTKLASYGIKTNLQTILTRDNMLDFDKYLEFAATLDINTLFISYLEGGLGANHPSVEDITQFKQNIIPLCKQVITRTLEGDLRAEGIHNLDQLFNQAVGIDALSRGVYNSDTFKGCKNKKNMALILESGDVHPCNAVEYFHEPIIGNVKNSRLASLWGASKWINLRQTGPGLCQLCPMTYHTRVKLK